MSQTVNGYPNSEVYMTRNYKLDDPYGHYSYWIALNDNNIDMGMPYSVNDFFSFDYRVTIALEQGREQVLDFVLDKPSFP